MSAVRRAASSPVSTGRRPTLPMSVRTTPIGVFGSATPTHPPAWLNGWPTPSSRPAGYLPPPPPLPLADDLRLERPRPVPRDIDADLAGGLGQHRLGPGAVAHVPRPRLWR